jgi:hypothetical protein
MTTPYETSQTQQQLTQPDPNVAHQMMQQQQQQQQQQLQQQQMLDPTARAAFGAGPRTATSCKLFVGQIPTSLTEETISPVSVCEREARA